MEYGALVILVIIIFVVIAASSGWPHDKEKNGNGF